MARITKQDQRKFMMEGDPDGAWVTIKALTPGERQQVVQASLGQELIYERGKDMRVVQKLNPRDEMLTKARLCIVDWGEIFGLNGKPLKCTAQNIERAVDMIEGFGQFIVDSLATLMDDIVEEKKEQEGN